ncbi:metal ABC transporter substrate-binding protein [Georgenia sp. TF02-10]|uniref:metal ABC transporter substrate-binding protein n=1 Tax=Georgenia sp. TF02-10 TaxID=2917725 RepID=UPI001FA7E6AE|nr:metal ABC transporter substrate-binding protein [Georgenia sp. TF02-10]UNX53528.1 metal ABC transporter substrate-binding protein [Georgenia sp. TF02-10]
MKRRLLSGAVALAVALPLAACSADAAPDRSPDGKLEVLAAFYPLQYLAQEVGGEHVEVSSLTPAGAEPHDLELSPNDVTRLSGAGAVLYLSGFQPAVDDAVAQTEPEHALDVAGSADLHAAEDGEDDHAAEEDHTAEDHAGHDHGNLDPHFWLDPARLARVAEAVGEELGAADPDNADAYAAGAADVRERLLGLDAAYREGLAQCQTRTIVVAHEAYGYLAEAYDLTQVGLAGLDPETEPSPARLREVAEVAREAGTTTIFTESLVNPEVAQTLADDLGLATAVLDPVEAQADPDADYADVMTSNLTTLRSALECA